MSGIYGQILEDHRLAKGNWTYKMDGSSWSKRLKKVILFGVLFVIIFNAFFLGTIADGSQTFGMFVLISILIAILNMPAYVFSRQFFKTQSVWGKIFIDIFLLFFIPELIAFLFAGEASLFGLFAHGSAKSAATADIIQFREKRDFGLSSSFLSAAILSVFMSNLFGRKAEETGEISVLNDDSRMGQ